MTGLQEPRRTGHSWFGPCFRETRCWRPGLVDEQIVEISPGRYVARLLSLAEHARRGARKEHAATLDAQHAAFPQADDRRVVHLMILAQALVARLAEMFGK